MSVKLVWSGLEEFKADLRNLPAALTEDAGVIVITAAEEAANAVVAAYPERTGNLRRGVGLKNVDMGRFGAGAVVYNKAKHAWLYDNGTEARHWASGRGTKQRSTGCEPCCT